MAPPLRSLTEDKRACRATAGDETSANLVDLDERSRWKQFRAYFADIAPAPMNGYPKVLNIESDPREEHNIGEMYEWVVTPVLKVVEQYKATLAKRPNPPAANMARF